jgi:sodium-dependent dicarboxylate transporter 2/3/5
MIMSNTATAAMMLALIAPVVDARPAGDRFARCLVLAVPAGANVGGMASLVGTPPNAIAAGLLAEQTENGITFARWLAIGLPPALVLEAILMAVLLWQIRGANAAAGGVAPALPEQQDSQGAVTQLPTAAAETGVPARRRYGHTRDGTPIWQVLWVSGTLLVTLSLWMTQDLHGLPTPVVAVVPIVLLTATGILDVASFRGLPFDVLFLLAGGLALGHAVQDTGLATWLVGFVDLGALSVPAFTVLAGAFAVALSNVMSNTAAANVLVPLVLTASVAAGESAALTVALCASAAMALPVATPPNALAAASGRVGARDFLLLGSVAGAVTPLLTAGWVLLTR